MSEIRFEQLLGRPVRAGNGRIVGRLEECRYEHRGDGYVITDYVIGVAGLIERLGLGMKLLVGRGRSGYVARWDQIDISDPSRPRLRCGIDELRTR